MIKCFWDISWYVDVQGKFSNAVLGWFVVLSIIDIMKLILQRTWCILTITN
jgi:hypothetical protein